MSGADTLTPREGQTFQGRSPLVRYANFVKLPHTVFALPFALVGVLLASYVAEVTWQKVVWVVISFTAARFAAMAFNRVVDRDLDSMNPRTKARELPSGSISVRSARLSVVISALVFVFSASRLNRLCLALAPVALGLIFGYSYTKRFTQWSHLVLGLALAIAPVGGYLAVTADWSTPWWLLVLLALAVLCWVGGFDILYSLQDIDFDREHGLYSLPAKVGAGSAILLSRLLHVGAVVALAAVGFGAGGSMMYGLGLIAITAMLLWEHSLVKATDLSRLDAAFFMMNGVISITFLCFVLFDRLASR